MTALLKKRLKFLILLSLILIQVKRRHKKVETTSKFSDPLPCDWSDSGRGGEFGCSGFRLIIILTVVLVTMMLFIMAIMMMLNMVILMMTR